MFKPFDERCIARIDKRYIFDKKKPVLDDQGNQVYEQEQEGTVISSNIEGIKKGMKIIPLGRGGVPIIKGETKKHYIVVFDREDIYAIS